MTSIFGSVGDAGAGHSAAGSLYRLFVREKNTYYELETRIGETHFQNYPSGSIKEFTANDRTTLAAELRALIDEIAGSNREKHLFPKI